MNLSSPIRLQEARLISIGANPDNPWVFTNGIDISGKGAKILDPELRPGNYGMNWDFLLDKGAQVFVKFDLVDGLHDEPVDTMTLCAAPYFSGQEVANRARRYFGECPPSVKALSELFPQAVSPDPKALAKRLLHEQGQAFRARMNKWIDFTDADHAPILIELHQMIGATFEMLPPEYKPETSLIRLPEDYRIIDFE